MKIASQTEILLLTANFELYIRRLFFGIDLISKTFLFQKWLKMTGDRYCVSKLK